MGRHRNSTISSCNRTITLAAALSLAELRRDQGRHAEAEELARDVLAHRRESLGAEHPVTQRTVAVLESINRLRGRDDAANVRVAP